MRPAATVQASSWQFRSSFPRNDRLVRCSTGAEGGIKIGNGIAYGGGSGGQNGLTKGEYLRKNFSYIRDMIQKKIIYPALARRMGWEGKVTVSFIVVSDGRVRNIEVKEGSGRDILDKSAVETIRIASPFPAPPTEAQIIIPIFYKLI
jgi:protein TonB